MRSAGYVTRRIAFGRVTRVVVVFAGIVAAFGDASIAIVDHVTFVCCDYHRFVFGSEGPDQLIRLQRIYNFLLFHAIILSVLDVYGLY